MAIYESAAETAKKIRAALKKAFPDLPATHFSVRKQGHNAVRVGWVDYPSLHDVEQLTNRFKSGSYNPHEDMHNSLGYMENGQTVYGADYVFNQIEYSDARVDAAHDVITHVFGEKHEKNSYDYRVQLSKVIDAFNKEGKYIGEWASLYEQNKAHVGTELDANERLQELEQFMVQFHARVPFNRKTMETLVKNALQDLPSEWNASFYSHDTHIIVALDTRPWLLVHQWFTTNIQTGFDIFTKQVAANIKGGANPAAIDTKLEKWYELRLIQPLQVLEYQRLRLMAIQNECEVDWIERSERLVLLLKQLKPVQLSHYGISGVRFSKLGQLAEVIAQVDVPGGNKRLIGVTPLSIRLIDTNEIFFIHSYYNLVDLQAACIQLYPAVAKNSIQGLRNLIDVAYDKRRTLKI